MKVIFDRPDVIKATYDEATETVLVAWKEFGSTEHIRPCFQELFKTIEDGARAIVLDISETNGQIDTSDQKWFEEDALPRLLLSDLKAIVRVVPGSLASLMPESKWKLIGTFDGVDFIYAADVDVAQEQARKYALCQDDEAGILKSLPWTDEAVRVAEA